MRCRSRRLQRPAGDHRPRRLNPRPPVRIRAPRASNPRHPEHRLRSGPPSSGDHLTERHPHEAQIRTRTPGLAAAALTLSLGLAACGGDDERRRQRQRRHQSSEAPLPRTPTDASRRWPRPGRQTYGDGCARSRPTATARSTAWPPPRSPRPPAPTRCSRPWSPPSPPPTWSSRSTRAGAHRVRPDRRRVRRDPRSDLNALLKDKETLTTMLTHHVVGEQIDPDQLAGEFETLAGDMLTINGAGERPPSTTRRPPCSAATSRPPTPPSTSSTRS